MRHFGDLVDAYLAGDFIEIDIAGLGDRLFHIHPAVPSALPAMKAMTAKFRMAATENPVFFGNDSGFQRRQGHDHLEGRSGRVLSADRLVAQRPLGILNQRFPLCRADATRECIGIKGWHGNHREDIPRMDIHDNGRRAFLTHSADGEILKLPVDGQHRVIAGNTFLTGQLADHTAVGVHLDPAQACLAAQGPVVIFLDPAFANPKFRQLQQRIIFLILQIPFRYRPDIADDMGKQIAIWIIAGRSHIHLDTGERGAVHIDAGELLPR